MPNADAYAVGSSSKRSYRIVTLSSHCNAPISLATACKLSSTIRAWSNACPASSLVIWCIREYVAAMGSRCSTIILTEIPTMAQPAETSAKTGRLTALRAWPNGYDRGSPFSAKGPNRIRRPVCGRSLTTRSAAMNASKSCRCLAASSFFQRYHPALFTGLDSNRGTNDTGMLPFEVEVAVVVLSTPPSRRASNTLIRAWCPLPSTPARYTYVMPGLSVLSRPLSEC
mmetsp:Transcript_28602/g.66411  ORF Transcript_28602/g.66411 Transcript_28602/m.66411 type:complete len:227 (-) Transcript_28602:286-966(-)